MKVRNCVLVATCVGLIGYGIWVESKRPKSPDPPPVTSAIPITIQSGGPDLPIDAPWLVILVIDGSGSFRYFKIAIDAIAPYEQDAFYTRGIIGSLPRNSIICVMVITNRASECDTAVPPTAISYNEFNPNSRVESMKPLSKRIRGIKFPDTYGTDVKGALYRAGLIVGNPNYADYRKAVLVFSDLADTEEKTFCPDLAGATVKVFFFSQDMEPEKTNIQKPVASDWIRYFNDFGAASAEIIDVDNSYNPRIIFSKD